MANFNTHISIAAIASGLAATALLKLDAVSESEAILVSFLGTLGGILPDIDLKYSHPSRIIFNFLGILASFVAVFAFQETFSIIELWMTAVMVFLLVRYPIWLAFDKFTTHRGAVHSILTATFLLYLTSSFAFHVFHQTALFSWLCGFFMFFGFILHLALDELYSVDFVGNRLKRSFGSALKIADFGQWISSTVIACLTVFFWLASPATEELTVFASKQTLEKISTTLLPDGGWFGTHVKRLPQE